MSQAQGLRGRHRLVAASGFPVSGLAVESRTRKPCRWRTQTPGRACSARSPGARLETNVRGRVSLPASTSVSILQTENNTVLPAVELETSPWHQMMNYLLEQLRVSHDVALERSHATARAPQSPGGRALARGRRDAIRRQAHIPTTEGDAGSERRPSGARSRRLGVRRRNRRL